MIRPRLAALLIAVVTLAGACSAPRPTPQPAAEAPPPARATEPAPTPEPVPAASGETPIDDSRIAPIAPIFTEGLELAWWITRDADNDVAPALAPFAARPAPIPAEVRDRWEHAGFRLLTLDESEVHDLLGALAPVGLVRRDWIGRQVTWTECFRSPAEAKGEPRRVVGLPHPVRPERLRFLTRAWSAPGTDGHAPVLRVDLALQLYTPTRTVPRVTLDEPRLPRAEREGEIITDVTAELTLHAGQVLLITGEAPGVVWGERPEPPPDERPEAVPAERFDPAVGTPKDGPPDAAYGPRVEHPVALGQAMLTAETSAIFPAPTRTIILLIPRVPARFSLLP